MTGRNLRTRVSLSDGSPALESTERVESGAVRIVTTEDRKDTETDEKGRVSDRDP
jgi:hypothetical protein